MSLLSVIARLPDGARYFGARCETSMPFRVVVIIVIPSLEVPAVVPLQRKM
jgi:hypothetical protein